VSVALRGGWAGVALGIGLAAFAAYHQFKLPVVLPLLLERYGYDRTLAGAFVSVYAVAGLLLSVWIGRTVQRGGVLRPIVAGLLLMACGAALTLLIPQSGPLVLAARALEGVAFSALAVVGPVIANANAPPGQLGLVAGLTAAWIPIGQLTATLLARVAVPRFDWSVLWWVGIGLCLVITVGVIALRRSKAVNLPEGSPAPAAGDDPGHASRAQTVTLVLVAAVFMLWSGQYFAFMTWLPQYLVEVQGIEVEGALLGYVIPVSFVVLFCLVAGLLMRAGVSLGDLLIGSVTLQAMVWWFLPYAASQAWLGAVCLVAYGASAGIVPSCLFAMPGAIVGGGRGVAAAFGILMTGRNLGVLVGPVLLALLAGQAAAWTGAQVGFAALTSLAALLAVVIAVRL
jgi:MFS family permease